MKWRHNEIGVVPTLISEPLKEPLVIVGTTFVDFDFFVAQDDGIGVVPTLISGPFYETLVIGGTPSADLAPRYTDAQRVVDGIGWNWMELELCPDVDEWALIRTTSNCWHNARV